MNRVVYVALLSLMLIALASCGDGSVDTTPTFSLSGSDVTVVQGSQNKAAIAFAFNPGAKDVVTLSLESPEGIMGTFEPATVSITSPKSLLSVNVAASVVPGKYELIVKGMSGARVNTARIQLTVEAVPVDTTPTFSLSGTPVTISQGDSGTSTITATFDAGATDTVTLNLESPDAGITGTFEPTTVNASSANSILSLNVATSVAPGSYELTVKGSSGAKNSSTKIQLVVEMMEEPTEIITPSSTTAFSITLRINGTLSASQRKAFVDAARRWSTIITASTGVEENATIPRNACSGGFPEYNGRIANLLIDLRLVSIDGEGGILGRAGPCLIRRSNNLTSYGQMEFDIADVATLETAKQFELVILHEMGHVLGFGTLWEGEGKDLLDEPCRSNSSATAGFKGAEAVMQFDVLGEMGNPPIENDYGSGTRCGHWDEGFFDNELMTGFLGGVTRPANPLSALTIASMADLGYEVDLSKAASYAVPTCSPSCDNPTLRTASIEEPWEIILRPEGIIDAEGNIVFFQERLIE